MENYWELEPSKVQVEIKDEKHLDELFKMCELFDLKNYKDKYRNSNNWFRMSTLNPWFSNYTFEYKFTEVTTEQFYEILSHNYGYQGDIKGFDKDVVLRMLECQVEQGNKRDIKVFEKNQGYLYRAGGFDWSKTWEGFGFWDDTIKKNKGKFTKQQPATVQDLEVETQSKEVERLNEEIDSLKLKNADLESEQIRLRNINKTMSDELTMIENSYQKLEEKNKKLKKIVRCYVKE